MLRSGLIHEREAVLSTLASAHQIAGCDCRGSMSGNRTLMSRRERPADAGHREGTCRGHEVAILRGGSGTGSDHAKTRRMNGQRAAMMPIHSGIESRSPMRQPRAGLRYSLPVMSMDISNRLSDRAGLLDCGIDRRQPAAVIAWRWGEGLTVVLPDQWDAVASEPIGLVDDRPSERPSEPVAVSRLAKRQREMRRFRVFVKPPSNVFADLAGDGTDRLLPLFA